MKKSLKILSVFSFAIYIAAVIYIAFFKNRNPIFDITFSEYFALRSNLIPFNTISRYLTALTKGILPFQIPLINLIGNLILFLPFPLYIACFFKKARTLIGMFTAALIVIITVETLQALTHLGSFDVDDIFLNMCGAAGGIALRKIPYIEKHFSF